MQEQLVINNGEIDVVKQRIVQLRKEALYSGNDIPEAEGNGKMVTEVCEMAETFATLRESIVCLLDSTISYIDHTITKFATVEQKAIDNREKYN